MTAHPIILCNGATAMHGEYSQGKYIELNYRDTEKHKANIKLTLPDFIRRVNYLSPRVLDLLEIATYVFCGDRLLIRGRPNDLEYHKWSRDIHFGIKVRDCEFWNTVKGELSSALKFMSGDLNYTFTFEGGHSTPATGLFDNEEFKLDVHEKPVVALFSGGLDSTAGALDLLTNTDRPVCLVSHRSGLPSTTRTQNQLVGALQLAYPGRVSPYAFKCNLVDLSRVEETQRTRAFLYAAIAFALATGLSQQSIYVYENGVTAVNLAKRADMDNARSSRTVHPQTITLLSRLFSRIAGNDFVINTPYLWKTKKEVFDVIVQCNGENLISSTVSCGRTFSGNPTATHCGGCSQCVDRKLASYAAGAADVDDVGIYNDDFIKAPLPESAMQTTLGDYIRQALKFAEFSIDSFYEDYLLDLTDLVDYLPGQPSEESAVESLYDLFHRHGTQVFEGMEAIRSKFDNLRVSPVAGSLVDLMRRRNYIENTSVECDQKNGSVSPISPVSSGEIKMTQKPDNQSKDQNSMEIFYSYSHKDERLRKKLETHLKLLEREGAITGWHDRKITGGKEFEGEIDEHLNRAKVILLLVSADFIASDYCYDIELERAMERHQKGESRVIPIILRECDWHKSKFGKLTALPTDGQSATGRRWKNLDEAFADITRGIRAAVKELARNSL